MVQRVRRDPATVTDEELAEAVKNSTSFMEVLRRLNMSTGTAMRGAIKRHISALNLPMDHFTRDPVYMKHEKDEFFPAELMRKIPREQFAALVATSQTPNEFCERAGLPTNLLRTTTAIRKVAEKYGIDASHLYSRSKATRRFYEKNFFTEVLGKNGKMPGGGPSVVAHGLVQYGLVENRCHFCSRESWQGEPIPKLLVIRNGDRTDLRLENLALACPNCHSQRTLEERRALAARAFNGHRRGRRPRYWDRKVQGAD